VDNDSFGKDITSKPYLKYEYQAVSKGPKTVKKEAFLKAFNNGVSDHLYGLNPLGKKGWCFFCIKKSTLKAQKEQESVSFLFQATFKLNHSDLIEVSKKKEAKRERFRGKQTKW
jgi:hypothetical protein